MEENRKIFNSQEDEVMFVKKRSFNIYVRRSFFCVFIFFIICSGFLINSSSKVYKKQREVNVLKSQISVLTEELESLQLEILNLKGFDKVMEYAEFLGMMPAKLGDSVVVDLNKDNFDTEIKEEPNKPLIIRLYNKITGRD